MSRRRGSGVGGSGAGAWGRWLVWGVVGCACCMASAQIPQYNTAAQSGRLLDANQQIGAAGYNAARPVSPLMFGNVVTTGNVRGGFAFQGYSPISDPTSFRALLGSSQLYSFRRDSTSIADAGSGYYGVMGMPYYDPSQTAATTGFLSGNYAQAPMRTGPLAAGVSRSRPPSGLGGALDLRLDYRLNAGQPPATGSLAPSSTLESQIVGLAPPAPSELSSSIFGPTPGARSSRTEPYGVRSQYARGLRGPADGGAMTIDWGQPRLLEPPGSRAPLGTPLDLVQGGVIRRFPIEPGEGPVAPPEGAETGWAPGPLTGEGVAAVPLVGEGWTRLPTGSMAERGLEAPPLRDVSVLPGYDVFTDMQLALSLRSDPGASWFQDMQAAISADPALAELLGEQTRMQAEEFMHGVLESPIQTFHGRGDSAKNDEMLKAEALLEIGRYYEAVRRYEVARSLDPLDPLPLIGKGNALLAAGEYLSATVALVQGFERYPELSRFQFDLPALIGGSETIDMRRADIMRRLEQQDDPRLRFLLGYLEYYTGEEGLRESAMKNFDRAAELDRSGSIISRFPAMIRSEGTPPPPKLPGPAPLLPDGVPGGRVPGAPRGGSPAAESDRSGPQSPERKER